MGQRKLLSFARDVQIKKILSIMIRRIKSVTLQLPARNFLFEEYAEEEESLLTKEWK